MFMRMINLDFVTPNVSDFHTFPGLFNHSKLAKQNIASLYHIFYLD